MLLLCSDLTFFGGGYIHTYMYVCIHVCMYLHIYIYVYICICIQIQELYPGYLIHIKCILFISVVITKEKN